MASPPRGGNGDDDDNSDSRQLDFGAVQHCGSRRNELEALLSYVKNNSDNTSDDPRPASVWIQAEPGVGKSNLLQQFRETISRNTQSTATASATATSDSIPRYVTTGPTSSFSDDYSCICILGKFEERAAASEPFAAFSDALGELVQVLLRQQQLDNPSVANGWASTIQEALGTELPLLLGILPILKPLVATTDGPGTGTPYLYTGEEEKTADFEDYENPDEDDDDEADEDAFGDFSSKEWRFERFRLAFRTLIRHICHRITLQQPPQQRPKQLVLILDDLHWVDPDSIQVIKTLLEDKRQPSNFLLVAATRPTHQYPSLQKFREALSSLDQEAPASNSNNAYQRTRRRILLKVMDVTPLSVPEIKELLVELVHQYTADNSDKDQAQQTTKILDTNDDDDHDDTTAKESTKIVTNDDDDTIEELAKLVKDKTQGNFFVVMQFLRLLERSRHIVWDSIHSKWQFDLDGIGRMEAISENVSDVVAQNLEAVQGRRRSALMVAASFGVSQFDVSTIVHAVTVLDDESKDSEDDEEDGLHDSIYEDPFVVSQRMLEMNGELTEAACQGFVEETSPGHYRFSHDRIRESAYSLLPSGDSRKEVHLKVGRQLRSWMDTTSELGLAQGKGFSKESLLLHAAKQSNLGADLIDDEWELLDLAELNYQAAELAARKAAFFSSIEYLQVGLSHLGVRKEEVWDKHYDLALKFSNALVRMQYSCGLLDECWETSQAVIQHGKNFGDKSRTYHTRVLCLMQQGKLEEAMKLCLEIFQLLDMPWPKRNVIFHCLREYTKVRRFLKNTSDEDFLALPIKDDENLQAYLDFSERMVEAAYFANNMGYLLYYTVRGLGLIADGKNHDRAHYSTVIWGAIGAAMFCDFEGAYRYGKLAMTMADKTITSSPHLIPRTKETYFGTIMIWQEPLRTCLPGLEESYRGMWKYGSVEAAIQDASVLLQTLFCCGEPLAKVNHECDIYAEAYIDYNQPMHWYINAPIYQAVLNLQGRSNNPTLLTGSLMMESTESFRKTCEKTSNKAATFQLQFWSMFLAYHFREYQVAKSYLKSMRGDLMEDGPLILVSHRPFYTGLVYFGLFRETRKSKYRRRALAAYRKLKVWWLDKGVVACEYMCLLLEAEDQSTRRMQPNVELVTEAYSKAIQSASEAGILHHHALAHELAGEFLYSKDDNSPLAKQHLSTAVQLYQQWGATAKVNELTTRHNGLGLAATDIGDAVQSPAQG